jgi:hypothetical protein
MFYPFNFILSGNADQFSVPGFSGKERRDYECISLGKSVAFGWTVKSSAY